MSQTDTTSSSATQPKEPKKSSPIRLIVLLGLLAVLLVAFLVDTFYMYDSVKAASERLQAAADESAALPRKDGRPQFLTRDGVAQAIGFQPTTSTVEDGRLVEHYRWWGSLPLQRRFIMVQDPEGKGYNQYEISNRNIFGQDEDDEAVDYQQPADPNAPPPPTPAPPMPGSGVMPPAGVGPPGSNAGEDSNTSPTSEAEPASEGEPKSIGEPEASNDDQPTPPAPKTDEPAEATDIPDSSEAPAAETPASAAEIPAEDNGSQEK